MPVTQRSYVKLVVDWTENGQGLVLDPATDPMTVVGTHDEPDLQPVIDDLHEQIANLQRERDSARKLYLSAGEGRDKAEAEVERERTKVAELERSSTQMSEDILRLREANRHYKVALELIEAHGYGDSVRWARDALINAQEKDRTVNTRLEFEQPEDGEGETQSEPVWVREPPTGNQLGPTPWLPDKDRYGA